ncbi:MAG: UDP-N-acetylmuramoyl-L-alanine--D-glutamate ligase [Salinisphaeraceae bacterium]|nr:UDP-N-acetylmuramoyl-L-alanine--D-glutamate ligase [Salinisphaeraceae bacterium]
MEQLTGKRVLIAGLGATGWSCVRHLHGRGAELVVTDTREQPPCLEDLQRDFPRIETRLGRDDAGLLDGVDMLVVSPGVDLRLPYLLEAKQRRLPVLGDIELFAEEVRAPVVAITGSNGKSTVTTLVAEMARAAGLRMAVGGNIGTPALDLLDADTELYVLELSSFQLELTNSLKPAAAVALNVSADHIDRHGSVEHYAALKTSIYRGIGVAVVNRDDPLAQPILDPQRPCIRFGLGTPKAENDYGILGQSGEQALARGEQVLLPLSEMRIHGLHNASNALAALALGEAVGLPQDSMLNVLREFGGLPHRCQWVAEIDGVNWYNDSKGTNTGATLAALKGLPGPIVLLAGGQAKDADFSAWKSVLAEKARAVILFGEDADNIAKDIEFSQQKRASNLQEAVQIAAELAQEGDAVLLSPGCASFDQFKGFADRGEQFMAAVRELDACSA